MSTTATGPITESGKETVSRNALKHGLTGKTHAALPGEESAFEQHCAAYRKAYNPVGVLEEDLVRNIAENQWRLRRAHALEDAAFELALLQNEDDSPIASQAQAFVDPKNGIQRTLDKQLDRLKAMQDERNAAFEAAREEAVALTQLASAKGQNFDPALHF